MFDRLFQLSLVIQNNKFWFSLTFFLCFLVPSFRLINIEQKNVIDFFSVKRQSVLTEHKRQTCTHIVFTSRFRFSYAHTYTHFQYCISFFHLVKSRTIKQCSIIRTHFQKRIYFIRKCDIIQYAMFYVFLSLLEWKLSSRQVCVTPFSPVIVL